MSIPKAQHDLRMHSVKPQGATVGFQHPSSAREPKTGGKLVMGELRNTKTAVLILFLFCQNVHFRNHTGSLPLVAPLVLAVYGG